MMGKKVVGIAMGGYSSEREISLESGNTVFKSLPKSRWECYRIVVDEKTMECGRYTRKSLPTQSGRFLIQNG